MLNKFKAAVGGLLVALFGPSLAFAAAVDVDGVVTDIAAQITPITAIGGGVLLVLVAIAAFKWVKRAFSILLPVGGAMLAMPDQAEAAAVSVTAVVADIAAQITPITAIGGGVLLVLVAIAAFKWVKRAF